MLAIRFMRTGRRNRAFFRIVLTESSRPPKSNYIKELGWFDPHTKQTSLHEEEILKYLNTGAKPSNSVAKLLLENKIKHKQIIYKPDAPKAKKGKDGEEKSNAQAPKTDEGENKDNPEEVANSSTEEETKENEQVAEDTQEKSPVEEVKEEVNQEDQKES